MFSLKGVAMLPIKTLQQMFRSRLPKVVQLLNTGPFAWGIILLSIMLYFLPFLLLNQTTGQMGPFLAIGMLPVALGALLRARKGGLTAWFLVIAGMTFNDGYSYYVRHASVQWELVPFGMISPLILALIVGYLRNISNRLKTAYQELSIAHTTIQKQALTDALTGLPNHRAVMDQLNKEIERTQRYDRPLSLLFFDADRFKHVNDTYGHAVGDAVLCQMSERVGNALRGGDTLGRFGGEEFVVLLPETDADEASIIAERIRSTVAAEPIATAEVVGGIAMTVSIGLSTYQVDGVTEQELLSQADEAMYVAKRLGRNQVRTAEEARQMGADVELLALFEQERTLEIALREGVPPEHLRETYTVRMICSLLSLLERRDESLSEHAHAVSDLATTIAQKMELEPKEIERIGMAALLHDIGKVAIPDRLLQKSSLLTSHEQSLLWEHAVLGAQILEASPFLSDLMPAVRHHHERWDGSGYPDHLSGKDIPLAARIIAVAEAYNFMCREHPYQASRSPEEIAVELQRGKGTQFDALVVQALAAILSERTESAVILPGHQVSGAR